MRLPTGLLAGLVMITGHGDERVTATLHPLESSRAIHWATEITGRSVEPEAADMRKPPGRFDRELEVNDAFSISARHAWVWENNPSGL